MTTTKRCPTVWELPFGDVACGDEARYPCAGCGTRYCAACLVPADLCDECLDRLCAGDAAVEVAREG